MRQFWFLFLAGMLVLGCSDNSENTDKSSSSEYSEVPSSDSSSSSVILSNSSSSGEASSSSSTETTVDVSSSSSLQSQPSVSSSSDNPPVAGVWPKLQKGQDGVKEGWGSRYWDGCKPHCSLRNNVDTNAVPFKVCRNCDINNNEIPTFTLSPDIEVRYDQWANKIAEDWIGYKETVSSCVSGGISYACWDMAPYKLNDTLAYAFMATALKNASCGQCFQLQFDGGNHGNDVKEAHRQIKGQTLIVMATNTGSDVEDGQFDIMIPGGGPGMFDSFSNQMEIDKNQLGANDGGFLTTCQRELNDYDKPAAQYQECVREKCNTIFSNPKHKNLLDGCLWFADWYKAADNPTYIYKKVDCPQYFLDKYPSTINTEKDNKFTPKAGFNKNIPEGYETVPWTW
jgi:hypothetical protein